MLRAVEWMQGKVQELEMHLARGSGIYVQLKPCLYLNDAMPHNYPLVRWLIGCTSLIHDSSKIMPHIVVIELNLRRAGC